MCYTHYFEQKRSVTPDAWATIVNDFARLLAAKPAHVGLATKGDQALEVSPDMIYFNGCDPSTLDATEGEDLGHETFVLQRDSSNETDERDRSFPFRFCKTARKPYDLVVCAALIVAQRHAPDAYDISSDGTPDEWLPALEFVTATLGEGYVIPKL